MTLPASGNAISINSLVGEYGGSAPHSMSEYYRGGGLVANHSNNANVPTSGTIALSNFHGQSNTSPTDNQVSFTSGSYAVPGAKFGDTSYGVSPLHGSWSDQSFTNSSGSTTFTMKQFTHSVSSLASTGYVIIAGNYNNQTWGTVTGYTGAFKQGSTLKTTILSSTPGSYNSTSNQTQWIAQVNNQLAGSGSITITIS
tara:strand:+ start:53 stop:646 length:594 start_codon:yes stop_codon:yes gene_type:complete